MGSRTALLALLGLALQLECFIATPPPKIEKGAKFPKRSSADSALLEWGNSAIIHNADGVVARFGPAATHPEFELGIEADLVTASPRQGCTCKGSGEDRKCGELSNAAAAFTQIVVMHRGGCSFRDKVEAATKAGAAALIVVNNDRRSPDRAFAMSLDADEEEPPPDEGPPPRDASVRLPSLMVSYAAGQQLREHGPRRMRIFAGGDRPFIESVTDQAPLLYLVHNAITAPEIKAAKAMLSPALLPHAGPSDFGAPEDAPVFRATRTLGALRGAQLAAFYERVASIVGYPVEHLSELALERRRPGAAYALREHQKLQPLNARGVEDARARVIMTVYAYLDDVDEADGGALYFPRARPAAVKVQPTAGLAAIFYSALEDGKLDRTAAHGDGPLRRGEAWVLVLRVYDRPRPLARRVLLPLLLWPVFRGAAPKALALASHRFFARAVGDARADAAIDVALYAVAAVFLLPLALLGYVAYKAFEKSRAPPKRVVTSAAKGGKKKGKKGD
eukprot:CAMPEP_0119291140 /NCGR_PEP_ID=MMETSP1329-20130426/41974_1 /TAXON_ID=114041 /ORGANISM="Genus nov. species nov., Strain RCC1024" /LENGTH=505 /DNA_ID=CAMNT_0007291967 /DNA_START=91 /DNA_END=1608 /DNA_ORIENTATION=-